MVIEERRWEKVGLSGANRMIRFANQETCAENVARLMADGHGHHFAVVGEGCILVLSAMAVQCLLAADEPLAVAGEADRRE